MSSVMEWVDAVAVEKLVRLIEPMGRASTTATAATRSCVSAQEDSRGRLAAVVDFATQGLQTGATWAPAAEVVFGRGTTGEAMS